VPVVGRISRKKSRKHRTRRLKSLAFIPTLMTLGNLICGFAAIFFAMRFMHTLGTEQVPLSDAPTLTRAIMERLLPSFLSLGAGLVILGMVFDCLDGLLARMTRSTTDFGGQLDSLADVVSFGVAPAILMVALMTRELASDAIVLSPISDNVLGRFAWVSAAVYVAFTAVRLARFNVEHARADFDHRTFRGLPSPGAAAVMVTVVLFVDQHLGGTGRMVAVYVMPIITLLTAFLMVSRVRYKRFHRAYLLGKKPFGQFVIFVLIVAAFFLYKAPTLLVLVLWYWMSGPVSYFVTLIRRRSGSQGGGGAATIVEGSTSDQSATEPGKAMGDRP